MGCSPLLLSLFVVRFGERGWDRRVLSWLSSTTMILGDETPLEGVRKVPPGCYLRHERSTGLAIRRHVPSFDTPLAAGDSRDASIAAVERLSRRLQWVLS